MAISTRAIKVCSSILTEVTSPIVTPDKVTRAFGDRPAALSNKAATWYWLLLPPRWLPLTCIASAKRATTPATKSPPTLISSQFFAITGLQTLMLSK